MHGSGNVSDVRDETGKAREYDNGGKRMTRTRTKALAVMLGASIAISGVCAAFPAMEMEVSALDTTTQVTYPFATGEDAFQYAPTFTMATEKASAERWEYVEVKFDGGAKDVRDAKYLAIQIRVDKGNPGLTVGLIENAIASTTVRTETNSTSFPRTVR